MINPLTPSALPVALRTPGRRTQHPFPWNRKPKPSTIESTPSTLNRKSSESQLPLQHSAKRLVFRCQTTSVSVAHATHCASHCIPCRPLIRTFSGWIRTPSKIFGILNPPPTPGTIRNPGGWRPGGQTLNPYTPQVVMHSRLTLVLNPGETLCCACSTTRASCSLSSSLT